MSHANLLRGGHRKTSFILTATTGNGTLTSPWLWRNAPQSLSSAAERGRVAASERVCGNERFSTKREKKKKTATTADGAEQQSPQTLRQHLGGAAGLWSISGRGWWRRAGCFFDDERGVCWTSVAHNEGIRYSQRCCFSPPTPTLDARVTLFIKNACLFSPSSWRHP